MPEDLDMFGQPILPTIPKGWPRPVGYRATPGTGPQGETCKTCDHSRRMGGWRRSYYKCWLMRHAWTCSVRTDILAKSPACSQWKAPTP